MNSDGAVKWDCHVAGCGGLMRDQFGSWIWGFTKFVGMCSVLEAELWGTLEGLRLCFSKGYHRVGVQIDS